MHTITRTLLWRRRLWTQPASGKDSFQVLGTAYEKEVSQTLQRYLSMKVTQVGGRGDDGIDLMAEWALMEPAIKVIAQCKRIKSRVSPRVVRELEGTVLNCGLDHIGMLASTMPASEQCMDRIKHSKLPLMFMQISEFRINGVLMSHEFQQRFPQIVIAPIRNINGLHFEIYNGKLNMKSN